MSVSRARATRARPRERRAAGDTAAYTTAEHSIRERVYYSPRFLYTLYTSFLYTVSEPGFHIKFLSIQAVQILGHPPEQPLLALHLDERGELFAPLRLGATPHRFHLGTHDTHAILLHE